MMESDFTVEYNRFNNLSKDRTKLVQSIFEHSTHNAQVVRADNEVKTKETLFWRTEIKKTKKADEREDVRNIELLEHYRKCNWYMPLLLGSQHNNRFKRNTKVYVLSGEYKGRHGTIIGHDSGFDLKAWGSGAKSPLLRVVLMCPSTRRLEVRNIHQDVVKLVDLHNKLEFALPALFPSGPPDDQGRG